MDIVSQKAAACMPFDRLRIFISSKSKALRSHAQGRRDFYASHHVPDRCSLGNVVRNMGNLVLTFGLSNCRHRALCPRPAGDAGDMANNRGFARAVWPDEPVDRAIRHRHREIVESLEAIETLNDIFDFYQAL